MNDILLGVTQSELDEAINDYPAIPSRLLADPMWKVKNLTKTTVEMEFIDGEITLLPTRSRKDPPNLKPWNKSSKVRSFIVPHINLETPIQAHQLQDVRQFGTEDALLSNAEVIKDEIAFHREHHDATKEHLMLGAIKGKIMDADGSTVLYDLFNEFDISESQTGIQFSNKTTDVGLILEQTVRKMRYGLRGDVATGVTVLCSPTFFDKLVSHASLKEAYKTYQDNSLAREAVGGKFVFKGITFEIYDYTVNGRDLIEDGHAHAYLNGMRNGFKLFYAPANMVSEVNKLARPFYISTETAMHGRAVNLYTESNPLPICVRPQTLHHFNAV